MVKHLGVGRQIVVRQHRALAAAGGARRVQDRGQIVVGHGHGVKRIGMRLRSVEQRPGVIVVQREHMACARLGSRRAHPGQILVAAYNDRGLGIPQEVIDFARLVSGVERKVDVAGAQGRQVQHQRFGGFFYLGGHAGTLGQVERGKQVGDAAGHGIDVLPREVHPVMGFDAEA
jgi:hypothetical protein